MLKEPYIPKRLYVSLEPAIMERLVELARRERRPTSHQAELVLEWALEAVPGPRGRPHTVTRYERGQPQNDSGEWAQSLTERSRDGG